MINLDSVIVILRLLDRDQVGMIKMVLQKEDLMIIRETKIALQAKEIIEDLDRVNLKDMHLKILIEKTNS